MSPRNVVLITLLALCHLHIKGQSPPMPVPAKTNRARRSRPLRFPLPRFLTIRPGDSPRRSTGAGPSTEVPVQWEAQRQLWVNNTLTLTGNVVGHYRGYILRADKVVYDRSTSELEADGHVQVAGGPNDVLINADHGDMRLNLHTARSST